MLKELKKSLKKYEIDAKCVTLLYKFKNYTTNGVAKYYYNLIYFDKEINKIRDISPFLLKAGLKIKDKGCISDNSLKLAVQKDDELTAIRL